MLDMALLLTSELVTNSVLHSHAPGGAALVFRLGLSHGALRLEVEDPGHRGAVAPRPPDGGGGGGFGLNLVQQLSERWGLERVAGGGTRVWANIALGSPQRRPSAALRVEALPMPAADPRRLRTAIGAPELFPFPAVTSLVGRAAPAEELDEATSAVLANAIAAFSHGRHPAGVPSGVAATWALPPIMPRRPRRIASEVLAAARVPARG